MVAFEQRVQLRFKGRSFRLTVSGAIADSDSGSINSNGIQRHDAHDGAGGGQAAQDGSGGGVLRICLEEIESAQQGQPPQTGSAGSSWSSEFPAAYIEEVTKKTGNYKRFPIFVEMLLTAMQKPNATVALDLLTTQDLETVRGTASSGPPSKAASDTRMYLIVTYAVAFDRVHYPLPLVLDSRQSAGHASGQSYSSSAAAAAAADNEVLATRNRQLLEELSMVLKENDKLRYQIKAAQESRHDGRKADSSQLETDRMLQVITNARRRLKETLRRYPIERFSPVAYGDLHRTVQSVLDYLQRSASAGSAKSATSTGTSTSISSRRVPLGDRSGYKVIKSEPLLALRAYPVPARKAKSEKKLNERVAASVSPFRRFDPTQYVADRDRKLSDRRSRSRDPSVGSVSRNLSRSSSVASTALGPVQRASLSSSTISAPAKKTTRKPKHKPSALDSDDDFDGYSRYQATARQPLARLPSGRNANTGSLDDFGFDTSRPSGRVQTTSAAAAERHPATQTRNGARAGSDAADKIEQRLAQLQMYLSSVGQ
ncbi:hypothetical protein BC831DRAFT_510427 [Entophlyctis helioformis]|nr:hypothetical protein BC831DRAFT_510427 [Entophlyctis helioformis]